ncbi:helix-turn-helix transcriptional regulator [Chloroflexota bacterium]
MMLNNERLTMTIPEFAAVMGCSKYLAYSLAAEDKLPVKVIHLGENRLLVSRKAVLALLEAKDKEVGVTDNE